MMVTARVEVYYLAYGASRGLHRPRIVLVGWRARLEMSSTFCFQLANCFGDEGSFPISGLYETFGTGFGVEGKVLSI